MSKWEVRRSLHSKCISWIYNKYKFHLQNQNRFVALQTIAFETQLFYHAIGMTTGTCTGYTKSNKQGLAMWWNSLSIPFLLNLCLNINQSNLKCMNPKYPRQSHEMPAELYSTVQWWDIYWTTQVQWSTNNSKLHCLFKDLNTNIS